LKWEELKKDFRRYCRELNGSVLEKSDGSVACVFRDGQYETVLEVGPEHVGVYRNSGEGRYTDIWLTHEGVREAYRSLMGNLCLSVVDERGEELLVCAGKKNIQVIEEKVR